MGYKYTKARKAQTGCLIRASQRCPKRPHGSGRCQERAYKHTVCGR